MSSTSTKVRIRFTKQGDLRWISHRDLARLWERLLRRAGLELAFTQGFHPKPKISFPSALTLGIEALEEIVELELCDPFDLTEVSNRISTQMPAGMELLTIELPSGKSRMVGASYRIELPADANLTSSALIQSTIENILEAGCIHVLRDDKTIECSTRDTHFEIRLEGNKLIFSLPAAEQGASIRPLELLQKLGLEQLLTDGVVLQRTRVHLDHLASCPNPPGTQPVEVQH